MGAGEASGVVKAEHKRCVTRCVSACCFFSAFTADSSGQE